MKGSADIKEWFSRKGMETKIWAIASQSKHKILKWLQCCVWSWPLTLLPAGFPPCIAKIHSHGSRWLGMLGHPPLALRGEVSSVVCCWCQNSLLSILKVRPWGTAGACWDGLGWYWGAKGAQTLQCWAGLSLWNPLCKATGDHSLKKKKPKILVALCAIRMLYLLL